MADYSINAVTRRVVFSGSAGTGPYAFTFEVLAQTDIAVYFNATLLTLTTDYTVTVNANGTGSVTIVTGSSVPSTPVSSDQITIVGSRDIERTTDFVTAGDFRASAINEQLDSQIIMIQQIAEENKRGLRAPTYDPALVEDGGVLDLTLPTKASRAGKILAFDSNGNPAVGEDIGNWRGNWAATTAYSVRDLVKDASNYNVYRCNTAHTSSGTTPISSNADAAKWDLVVDAAYAATQASNAASSASAASTSASNAASSASAASTSAGNASTAQSAAEAAQSAAETAQAAAEAAQSAAETAADNFDDTYLGAKSSDPTVDNDGDALTAGDLYFNTTSNVMKVYTGASWDNVAVSAATVVAKTSSTGSAEIPVGTTGERDGSPATGYLRYNTTESQFEGYDGSAWGQIGVGAGSILKANTLTAADLNTDLTLQGNGTGKVVLGDGALIFPDADGSAGQFIKTDGAGNLSFAAGSGFQSIQVFSTSGTWTKPAGINTVVVTVVGGGGGGGGAVTNVDYRAQGGAGGGTSIKKIDVSAISSETVTVGTGGAGGNTSGTSGGTGNTSSFGAHCSATGGAGGTGQANTSFVTNQTKAGGVGSSGDVNIQGSPPLGQARYDSTQQHDNTGGGASYLGGGAPQPTRTNSQTGNTGGNFGGGGSGGVGSGAGGAGADGIVIVMEYA